MQSILLAEIYVEIIIPIPNIAVHGKMVETTRGNQNKFTQPEEKQE